jgi:hypothetical protein
MLICGTNKIVKNDEEAVRRIQNVAAPIDAQRLGKKTPCVKTELAWTVNRWEKSVITIP